MAGTRPLSPDQVASVTAVLGTFPARERALVSCLLYTGYRVTEALSLSVGDVWEGGVRARIRIARRAMKGGRGVGCQKVSGRSVPLNPAVSRAIEDYLLGRFGFVGPEALAEPLFLSRQGGGPLSRWQANRVLHTVLTAAGIAKGGAGERGAYGAHSFRKTYAQMVFKASGHNVLVAKAALNHRSLLSTQRYLSVDADEVDRIVIGLGSRAGEGGYSGAHRLSPDGVPMRSFG